MAIGYTLPSIVTPASGPSSSLKEHVSFIQPQLRLLTLLQLSVQIIYTVHIAPAHSPKYQKVIK